MTTTTHGTSRTAHLLALMKKGDDAFNARDFATVDTVHHPDMIAYIPGLAEPVYGRRSARRGDAGVLGIFPDMHVYSDPYPIQFGTGDWITVVTNATGTFTGGDDPARRHRDTPPPERRSTSSSARPPSGKATSSSSSPPSTTPPCSGSRSVSPSNEGCQPARGDHLSRAARRPPRGKRRPVPWNGLESGGQRKKSANRVLAPEGVGP